MPTPSDPTGPPPKTLEEMTRQCEEGQARRDRDNQVRSQPKLPFSSNSCTSTMAARQQAPACSVWCSEFVREVCRLPRVCSELRN